MDKIDQIFSIRIRSILNALLSAFIIYRTYAKMHETLPWYYTLKRSSYQPASWVFSVAWTLIYASWFFVLAYIYVNVQKIDLNKASSFLTIFLFNFYAQFLWTNLFAKHDLFNSLYALFASLIFSCLLVYYGLKISRLVGYALVLQAIWLLNATFLGLQTYLLNK
jgi:tryptophan-rich sensory protein